MRGLRGDTPVLAAAAATGFPARPAAVAAGEHSRITAPPAMPRISHFREGQA